MTADVLAVRLTTTTRELPTWVPLGGYVNTDNIETLGKDELGDYLRTLSPSSIVSVNRALAGALGIP